MAEEYSFPPYGEEVSKVIEKFGGTKMEAYDREDITPLRDLKGGGPFSGAISISIQHPKLKR